MGKSHSDAFTLAWGELESWQGANHQAQALTSLSPWVCDRDPAAAWQVARALGQAKGLVEHVQTQRARLDPSLRLPWLHQAYAALRRGQWGPGFWKALCWNRALSLALAVESERERVRTARVRVDAWRRGLRRAQAGVRAVQAYSWELPDARQGALWEAPPTLSCESEEIIRWQQRLEQAHEELAQEEAVLTRLALAVDRLEAKLDALVVLARLPAVSAGTVSKAPGLQAAVEQALRLPASGLSGWRE